MHIASRAVVGLTVLAGLAAPSTCQILEKVLTYTRFDGFPNVKRFTFTYDMGAMTTSISNIVPITDTPGADGVMFAPDGDLIVGGQGDQVFKVFVPTGAFNGVTAGGAQSYHVMLDPSGTFFWTAGNPGTLASVPLYPFANGTVHPLNGDDTQVTHVAFVGNDAFYTVSTPSGFGHFGRIDLNTFTTTRLFAFVPWAHGMAYDCYTGDLMVFGSSFVAQIDPVSESLVSLLNVVPLGLQLDQGTSDGEGHLYIASNTGVMLFVDMTITGQVGNPDFVDAPFLDVFLDDIAPDCGLGAPPSCPHTQGFWKTHPASWPVTQLEMGCQVYTQAQAIALFQTPVMGDASINLAHQLMSAKINVANNSNNWPLIVPIIDQADALLCTYPMPVPLGVHSNTVNGQQMVLLANQLDIYNNGFQSPGCEPAVLTAPRKR